MFGIDCARAYDAMDALAALEEPITDPITVTPLFSGTRKNPAHCSNALAPTLGTLRIAARDLNSPFSSLYLTIFFALVALIPEI